MDLKNKTALVTGASSGIGKAFAYLLAEKGANVVLVARNEESLNAISAEIRGKYPVETHVFVKDLSLVGSAGELYEDVRKKGIQLDILINNAGFGKWGKFKEFTLTTYQEMIQLNVTSLVELSYLFLSDEGERAGTGLINVGSTASFLPVPYSSVYAATKSFVLNFTEGLVGEYTNSPVKIHCLCPAGTATNFTAVASDNAHANDASMKSPEQVAKEGLDAFTKGKHYSVTGRKATLMMTKFLSRKRVIDMVAKSWTKRIGVES